MANTSNWKGTEADVARALGGKRRLRTTESYGKKADDVMFPKEMKKRYPFLKMVAVEVKKRKKITFTKDFVISDLKYCLDGKNLIFVTKLPATSNWRKQRKQLAKILKMTPEEAKKKIKRGNLIATLVTVKLPFFKILWEAWLAQNEEGVGVDG